MDGWFLDQIQFVSSINCSSLSFCEAASYKNHPHFFFLLLLKNVKVCHFSFSLSTFNSPDLHVTLGISDSGTIDHWSCLNIPAKFRFSRVPNSFIKDRPNTLHSWVVSTTSLKLKIKIVHLQNISEYRVTYKTQVLLHPLPYLHTDEGKKK